MQVSLQARFMAHQVAWVNLKINNDTMKITNLLIAVIIFLCSSAVNAQDKIMIPLRDTFLIQASIGNLQEAAIGKLAANKAVDPGVKAFANRMVTDHNNIETQLMQVIHSTGIQLPPEATNPPVEDLMLKNTPAKDFDRNYVHMMVADHRQTVQLFEKYALTGKNPAVKAFAAQTLPTLKEHLGSVTALDDKMKNSVAQ